MTVFHFELQFLLKLERKTTQQFTCSTRRVQLPSGLSPSATDFTHSFIKCSLCVMACLTGSRCEPQWQRLRQLFGQCIWIRAFMQGQACISQTRKILNVKTKMQIYWFTNRVFLLQYNLECTCEPTQHYLSEVTLQGKSTYDQKATWQ